MSGSTRSAFAARLPCPQPAAAARVWEPHADRRAFRAVALPLPQRFNALGWFLDKYIYFAAVLVLITGGVAATAYNDGAEQYVPPGGDTGAGEEIASKMLF